MKFYVVEIVKACSYLRANKILQRDIKPDNVMLDHSFHIKLGDFGLGVKYDENDKTSLQSKIYHDCKEVKFHSKTLLSEVAKIKEEKKQDHNSSFETDEDIGTMSTS